MTTSPGIAARESRHLSLVILLHPSLVSRSAAELLAKGIQDNSFSVEEADNQEPGVVQHILNVPVFFGVKIC